MLVLLNKGFLVTESLVHYLNYCNVFLDLPLQFLIRPNRCGEVEALYRCTNGTARLRIGRTGIVRHMSPRRSAKSTLRKLDQWKKQNHPLRRLSHIEASNETMVGPCPVVERNPWPKYSRSKHGRIH